MKALIISLILSCGLSYGSTIGKGEEKKLQCTPATIEVLDPCGNPAIQLFRIEYPDGRASVISNFNQVFQCGGFYQLGYCAIQLDAECYLVPLA